MVINKKEYDYDPYLILKYIVEIYISLAQNERFVEFVVNDEKWFSLKNLNRVIYLHMDVFKVEANKFQIFINFVKRLKRMIFDEENQVL
jgi:hypothetical protein